MKKKTLPGIDASENREQTKGLSSNAHQSRVIQHTSISDSHEITSDNLQEPLWYGREEIKRRLEVDRECGDYRHWSPVSQFYAPAHVLLQHLYYGWELNSNIYVKSFCCLRSRSVDVYYFFLIRDAEQIWMPVLDNPVVRRLIQKSCSSLVRLSTDAGFDYPNGDEAFTSDQLLPFYPTPMLPPEGLVESSRSAVYVQ